MKTNINVVPVTPFGKSMTGNLSNRIDAQANCAVSVAQGKVKYRFNKASQTQINSLPNNSLRRRLRLIHLFNRAVPLVVLTLIFAISTQAQGIEFWAFLGPCDANQTVQQTSMYQISYKANG